MTASWAFILALAIVVVVGLVARGIEAMSPGGSGALWAFLSAAAIVGFVTWAYRHRGGPQRPRKGTRQ